MTVCIAAICEDRRIIGASDRMITADDVQFEPQQSKIWILTRSIVAMYSGDSALQTEILQRVEADVGARIHANPTEWLTVRYVADLYREHYQGAQRKRAIDAFLSPLGLDANSFIGHQNTMDTALVRDLAARLVNYSFPPQSAIFAGVDLDGPQPDTGEFTYAHVYVASGSEVTCQDRVGFAAIGIGRTHAESQFMFEGHTKATAFPETLLLTYMAKKRAEVAPGVGKQTDMFSIGSALGSYFIVGDHVLAECESIWKENQKRVGRAAARSKARMKAFDAELAKKAAGQQEQIAKTTPPPPTAET